MAITVTEADIYRAYPTYNETERLLPDEAVFEQAIWLLRVDDAVLKGQQGVRSLSVAGVSISVEKLPDFICPEARAILGRKVGRYI